MYIVFVSCTSQIFKWCAWIKMLCDV